MCKQREYLVRKMNDTAMGIRASNNSKKKNSDPGSVLSLSLDIETCPNNTVVEKP
jgi:hypothetical protein